MAKKILLVMDGGLAEKFRSIIESNSQVLEVIPQSVPLFRNLIPSLKHFKPDIVFILMSRVEFETNDHKSEILKTIYQIKTDSSLSNLRIAIQTKAGGKDPFLARLASYQVYDIFSTHADSSIDMNKLMQQLSEPANLKNVKDYLKIPFTDNTDRPSVYEHTSSSNGKAKEKKRTDGEILKVPKNPNKDSDKEFRDNRKQVKQAQKLEKLTQGSIDFSSVKSVNSNSNKDKLPAKVSKPKQKDKKTFNDNHFTEIKPRRRENRKSSIDKKKRKHWLLILFITVTVVLLILFIGLKALGNPVENTPSFQSLISQGEYSKAAEIYPSKASEVENKMLDDPDVKDKAGEAASIMNYSDSDAVKFDNAYFNGDFKKVVEIYDDSSNPNLVSLSDERKTMLAYSYMKTNDIGDAKQTASDLNNKQLNEKIDAYQKFMEANKVLKEKLKNGNLNQQDKQKAKQQIKQNKIAMAKL